MSNTMLVESYAKEIIDHAADLEGVNEHDIRYRCHHTNNESGGIDMTIIIEHAPPGYAGPMKFTRTISLLQG